MGCTTSAWQSWWAVDWHKRFVLQFSICSAPVNFQTNRFNAALLSPAHLCPPPAMPSQPSSLRGPVTYTRFVLLSKGEQTTEDVVGAIPYSATSCCHTLPVSRRLGEQRVAGLQDMSRSQQPLLSQGQWGQSRSSGGGQAVRLSIPQSLTKCPWKTFSCCTNLAATKIHNTSSVTRMQNDSETKYLHLSKIQIVFLLLGNNKMAHLGEYNPASFLMRCCFC